VTPVPYDPGATSTAGTSVVFSSGATGSGTGTGTGSGTGSGGGTGSGSATETGGTSPAGALDAGAGSVDGSTEVSGFPMAAAGGGSPGGDAAAAADTGEGGFAYWPVLAGLALAAALVAVVVGRAEREHRRLAAVDHDAAVDKGSADGDASAGAVAGSRSPRREATA